jgi:hypothetical protein
VSRSWASVLRQRGLNADDEVTPLLGRGKNPQGPVAAEPIFDSARCTERIRVQAVTRRHERGRDEPEPPGFHSQRAACRRSVTRSAPPPQFPATRRRFLDHDRASLADLERASAVAAGREAGMACERGMPWYADSSRAVHRDVQRNGGRSFRSRGARRNKKRDEGGRREPRSDEIRATSKRHDRMIPRSRSDLNLRTARPRRARSSRAAQARGRWPRSVIGYRIDHRQTSLAPDVVAAADLNLAGVTHHGRIATCAMEVRPQHRHC